MNNDNNNNNNNNDNNDEIKLKNMSVKILLQTLD